MCIIQISYSYGISLAHNGNLINCEELRENLLCNLRCINTTSVFDLKMINVQDSELMLNIFAEQLEKRIDRVLSSSILFIIIVMCC